MTEQAKFSYAKTLQNTLEKNEIMRMAHGVIQANVSKPEVVQSHLSKIREMLANTKNSLKKAIKPKSSRVYTGNGFVGNSYE